MSGNSGLDICTKKKVERQERNGNGLFSIFANREKNIKIISSTRKKTEQNLRKLEQLKEYYTAKNNFDEREYEKVNLKIEKRKRALEDFERSIANKEEFEKSIENGIALYVSMPLSLVLQSNVAAMKIASANTKEKKEKTDKLQIVEEFEQILICEMDKKIKNNILNSTYNITENLADKLKEYKMKKCELETELKNKLEKAKEIEKLPSTWITITIQGIQMALVSLGALEVSTMEKLNEIVATTSIGTKTFVLTAAAIGMYKFIDTQGKKLLTFLYKIWFKHSTKRKMKELHHKYAQRKSEILNSLYDNLSETIHLHLTNMINGFRKKKIITDSEKMDYELMILKNTENDRKIIENLSHTIEKQL